MGVKQVIMKSLREKKCYLVQESHRTISQPCEKHAQVYKDSHLNIFSALFNMYFRAKGLYISHRLPLLSIYKSL